LNYYPNYSTRLYFGEVETPYTWPDLIVGTRQLVT